MIIKEINLYDDSTSSIRRDYIIKSFNDIYKLTNNQTFNLVKYSKILYKNNFFELKNDKLNFIGINFDFILDEINKILSFNKFIPKCHKDFALIHDTHNGSELNQSQTTVLLYRTSLYEFNNKTFKSILLKNKKDNNFDNKNKSLIIIENYKIFELENLKEYFKNFNIEIKDYIQYDTIYGSGNKINSSKNINLLNSYKEIFYFGDYDDEGYAIFKILERNLNIKCEFIFPKKEIIDFIQSEMQKEEIIIRRKNDKDYLIKDKELLLKFSSYKLFEMQQEVFLNDIYE